MAAKSFCLALLIGCLVGISQHQYLDRPERLRLYDYVSTRQPFGAPPFSPYDSYFQPFRNHQVNPWRIKASQHVPLPYSNFEEPKVYCSIFFRDLIVMPLIVRRPDLESPGR